MKERQNKKLSCLSGKKRNTKWKRQYSKRNFQTVFFGEKNPQNCAWLDVLFGCWLLENQIRVSLHHALASPPVGSVHADGQPTLSRPLAGLQAWQPCLRITSGFPGRRWASPGGQRLHAAHPCPAYIRGELSTPDLEPTQLQQWVLLSSSLQLLERL